MNEDFELFFQANERRIHFQIHRLGITGDSYEEFYTEGIVALRRAYQTHDECKGEIGTFCNYQIRYRLLDLLRKKIREQEGIDQVMQQALIELDQGNRHRATRTPIPNVHDFVLENEGNEAFWQEIRERLSERQWKWVHYFIIADLSVKEIMEIEGVSATAVKSWGREVRRKLRNDDMRRKLNELM